MRKLRRLTVFALATGAAWAQPSSQTVEVVLGETRSVEVGFAKGLNCDDMSVVDASLENKNAQTNALILQGKKLGNTTCRVGNAQAGPTVTVSITVVKPPPAKEGSERSGSKAER